MLSHSAFIANNSRPEHCKNTNEVPKWPGHNNLKSQTIKKLQHHYNFSSYSSMKIVGAESAPPPQAHSWIMGFIRYAHLSMELKVALESNPYKVWTNNHTQYSMDLSTVYSWTLEFRLWAVMGARYLAPKNTTQAPWNGRRQKTYVRKYTCKLFSGKAEAKIKYLAHPWPADQYF